VRDGSNFEQLAGYARAVRVGAHVAVSGTAAMSDGIVLHPGDVYGQTRDALDKALAAAGELGAAPDAEQVPGTSSSKLATRKTTLWQQVPEL
jgi:enamine deaminase RidA (YjgF/YER057c/UK114 family)